MKNILISLVLLSCALSAQAECPAWQDHSFRKLHSKDSANVCSLTKDKVTLFVNTASHCGFTKQYSGLEKLYKQYKDKGFVIVGFASDDFFQEANDESESAKICFINHGVTFTVFADTHVRGKKANPVFAELIKQSEKPSWNFNKYLVGKEGKVIKHFGSKVKPQDKELLALIDKALAHKN